MWAQKKWFELKTFSVVILSLFLWCTLSMSSIKGITLFLFTFELHAVWKKSKKKKINKNKEVAKSM
jgi:hypothetical protein